jgi:hypothetical protein
MAILKRAVFAYYLPIRLKGLLILQRARRPVSREKVLYSLHYVIFYKCASGAILLYESLRKPSTFSMQRLVFIKMNWISGAYEAASCRYLLVKCH